MRWRRVRLRSPSIQAESAAVAQATVVATTAVPLANSPLTLVNRSPAVTEPIAATPSPDRRIQRLGS